MSKQFDIKIFGKVFVSDDEGFLNLNDIKNNLGLPESKKPSRWDNNYSRSFTESRNLVLKEIKHLGAGATKYYAGDEEAVIGYAMFVSVELYREVIKAFVDLRNGRLTEAFDRAMGTMSESSEDKIRNMVWENLNGMKVVNQRTALQIAGIKRPIVFMRELRRREKSFQKLQDERKIVMQTYAQGKWTPRFTHEGFQWLLEKQEDMNDWVEKCKQVEKDRKKLPC
ncbi:hypothetical protein KUA24_71 [Vibrio phage HNL01]|nr:hypothetical protein KUA24_71 [Vibrio phage HNL01]